MLSRGPLKIFTLLAVVAAILIALLLGYEGLRLALFANDELIKSYHFGSESMSGHGGWAYRNRWNYFASSLIPSILLFFCAIFGIIGIKQNNFLKSAVSSMITVIIIGSLVWRA